MGLIGPAVEKLEADFELAVRIIIMLVTNESNDKGRKAKMT